SGALARAFLDPFHLVVVRFGPARIHAQQHLGPVLRLGAAGARVNFEIGVVAVGFARQQALGLALASLIAQLGEIGLGLGDDGLVAFGLAHLDQADRVVKLVLDPPITLDAALEARLFAHDRLRAPGIVPKIG